MASVWQLPCGGFCPVVRVACGASSRVSAQEDQIRLVGRYTVTDQGTSEVTHWISAGLGGRRRVRRLGLLGFSLGRLRNLAKVTELATIQSLPHAAEDESPRLHQMGSVGKNLPRQRPYETRV